jgi:tetratricopeptide (TPR) repeat protein
LCAAPFGPTGKRGLTPFSVLRAVPIVVLLALVAVSVAVEQIDRRRVERYQRFWAEGDRLALSGRAGEAEPLYRQSDRARPEDVVFLYMAVRDMASPNTRDPREAGLILECRLERLAQETGEIVRRDPGWRAPREDLALYALLLDRPPLAVEQYRQLLHSHPRDGQIRSMLAYVLLRAGNTAEAEESCGRAMELRKPPVEAMINLGVIRFSQGKDDEARALWEKALARDPKHPIARANIERLTTTEDRRIDLRYLARAAAKPGVADLVVALALHAGAYSDAERVRLLLEAAQLDAKRVSPHLALAQVYCRHEGALRDLDRALWHARHAVVLARDAGVPEDLAESLLVLGETLIAADRKDEARRALEEGKTKAPAKMVPEFDGLLRTLPAPARNAKGRSE